MNVSLTLFIPELTQPLSAWNRDFGFSPETPILSSLLNHARINKTNSVGFERSLFSSLGFPDNEELPIAKYRLEDLEDIVDQSMTAQQIHESQQTLLCADPVHCEAGMKDVTLTRLVNDLGKTETDELTALLNQHFGEDGLRFFAANNSQWYLQLPEKETVKTTVLADVLGKNIYPCLPTSKDRNWLALQNEVQMLLHSATINQTREISGLPSVNSLWFWGGGDIFKPKQRFDYIFARRNCTEAQVFAKANGTQLSGLSLSGIEKLTAEKTHRQVAIILDQLIEPAQAIDLDSWQRELNKLEKEFIEPLQLLWKKGQLDLSIDNCNGKMLTPLKKYRWKFWKPSSLSLLDLV
jgi:hypothetical protein